jgi:hypothetical protein
MYQTIEILNIFSPDTLEFVVVFYGIFTHVYEFSKTIKFCNLASDPNLRMPR